MKVLFVYTDIGISVGYSCGIGVLSAYLKQHGHDTSLIHVSDELGYPLDLDRIAADVEAYQPGLIAFSAVTNQWYFVRQIARFLRRKTSTPIVVGGHHANAVPEQVAAEKAIDFACKGEGERPLLELVECLEAKRPVENIPNLVYRKDNVLVHVSDGAGTNGNGHCQSHAPEVVSLQVPGNGKSAGTPESTATVADSIQHVRATTGGHEGGNGDLVDNPMGRWVDELDDLPFEDRDIFAYNDIVETRHGWAEVIASRGCPYACTYCFNLPFFNRYKNDLKETDESVTMRDFVRRRNVDSTIAMLRDVKDRFPHVKYFTFVDDVFAIYSRWLAELAPRYRDEVGVPFAATSQPLAFNENIAKLLQLMGCKVVKMGVEAGNHRIRNQVLNRNIPDKVLIDGFRLARQYGLKPQAFNMIGLPTETHENMMETVRLNAKLRAYIVWMSTFMPYPGTVLDDFTRKHDLLDEDKWDDVRSYRGGSVLKETSFTALELEQMRVLFKWHLNVALDNECSRDYQKSIDELKTHSSDRWMSGDVEKIYAQRDQELDERFRQLEVDHYVTKKYVNMFWAKEYDYDLT